MLELLHAIADVLNALRVIPRIMFTVAIYVWYQTIMWFMELPDPTMTQAGLLSIVTGAVTAWAGLYMNGGPKK